AALVAIREQRMSPSSAIGRVVTGVAEMISPTQTGPKAAPHAQMAPKPNEVPKNNTANFSGSAPKAGSQPTAIGQYAMLGARHGSQPPYVPPRRPGADRYF